MERDQFSQKQAGKAVIERDKARAYYYKRFFGDDDLDKPTLPLSHKYERFCEGIMPSFGH